MCKYTTIRGLMLQNSTFFSSNRSLLVLCYACRCRFCFFFFSVCFVFALLHKINLCLRYYSSILFIIFFFGYSCGCRTERSINVLIFYCYVLPSLLWVICVLFSRATGVLRLFLLLLFLCCKENKCFSSFNVDSGCRCFCVSAFCIVYCVVMKWFDVRFFCLF